MQPTLDMETIRQRISAALDASSDKSRSGLAKSLGISPAQVTSLLKPGGRRLQAAEVPIVERYLGITLLERGEVRLLDHAPTLRAPGGFFSPGGFFFGEEEPSPFGEGEPVDLTALPPDLASYFKSVMANRKAEVWRIATNLVEGAGYLPGEYVVVDRGQVPRPRNIVLAQLRESRRDVTPVFRAYLPPYLMAVSPRATLRSPLIVDDSRIVITGVIVTSVRTR
jgi:hypothetical protein